MTRITAEKNDAWTLEKIRSWVDLEMAVLKKRLINIQKKIQDFENRYGKTDINSLYGRVDDMELLEWEGEIETMRRLREKLACLDQIVFERDG